MNLLLVTDSFPPQCGGSGWSTYELARGLRSRGHRVRVVKAAAGARGVERRETLTTVSGDPELSRLRTCRFPASATTSETTPLPPLRKRLATLMRTEKIASSTGSACAVVRPVSRGCPARRHRVGVHDSGLLAGVLSG